jgi:hypothetical protein
LKYHNQQPPYLVEAAAADHDYADTADTNADNDSDHVTNMSQSFKTPASPTPPPSPASVAVDAHEQKAAQEYLDSQDAYAAAVANEAAAREIEPRNKRIRRMAMSQDDDDDDEINEDEASQTLMDEPQEWEKNSANPFPSAASQMPPPTLANMIYRLRHGSIHVRIHEENKDHVFSLMNNKLGRPILLFAQGMGELINTVLPDAYDAYDKNIQNVDELEEGKIVYSNAFVTSKYVKNMVEVSVFKGNLYINLKRMGNPEEYMKSPLFKKRNAQREPYNGPKLTPDADGFVFSKGCSISFDRHIDDPAKMLIWAMTCRSMPY